MVTKMTKFLKPNGQKVILFISKKLKSVANQFCEDRIVSCLEGGYYLKIIHVLCLTHKTLME